MSAESDVFTNLIKQYGSKKAIEIIQKTTQPLQGDFANEHKNLEAFSNNTTDEIIQQLDKEKT